MKLLFTNWALVLVWCHFVACSSMAIKCLKLINRALVLVSCHFVGVLLGLIWGAPGLLLGCLWAVLGCPGPDFLLIS